MAGREPKPTELKRLEGNPGKRPLNRNEPQPEVERPTCPSHLSNTARTEWRRIVPELERLGLLTMIDRSAFAGYCQAWARWRQCEESLKRTDVTYESPRHDRQGQIVGNMVRPYPEVAIARQMMGEICAFCTEFGLTPSSRGRINIPGHSEEDPMEALLDPMLRDNYWRQQ